MLIDLDGTLFRGGQVIPGALDFMSYLHRERMPYLYFTNNSTRTAKEVARHLEGMGFVADADHVYTSSMAMADYVRQKDDITRAFVLGEEGLLDPISRVLPVITEEKDLALDQTANGYAVIVGLDRFVTYSKLRAATRLVLAGSVFLGTNADLVLPDDVGMAPGTGSFLALLESATGKQPEVIGKPNARFVESACRRLGVLPQEVVVIGDNPATDIAAGEAAGSFTVLVSTGVPLSEGERYGANLRVEALCDLIDS